MAQSQQLKLNCSKQEGKPFRGYHRELILEEKQAYEGAKMFYFGVLPLSIIAIIFFTAFLYQESTITMRSSVLSISIYIFLTIATYVVAVYYYIKCNKIESHPAPLLSQTKPLKDKKAIAMISQQNYLFNENQNVELRSSLTSNHKPSRHFCSICQHVCEYRTKHCKKCQTCIERFDHHCFWIGNCVGKHNHRQFYLFLLAQSFNNWFQLKAILEVKSFTYESGVELHWMIWLMVYGMLLTSIGFLCFTGYLAIYHTMLMLLGITTWEQMRRDHISYLKYLPKGLNPFSIGWKDNIKRFFQEETRAGSEMVSLEVWQDFLPTYEQAKLTKPGFNLIDNEYYSCC